jgi:hypothetical protein
MRSHFETDTIRPRSWRRWWRQVQGEAVLIKYDVRVFTFYPFLEVNQRTYKLICFHPWRSIIISDRLFHHVLRKSRSVHHPLTATLGRRPHSPGILFMQPRQNDLHSVDMCLDHVHFRLQLVFDNVLLARHFQFNFLYSVCHQVSNSVVD